MTEQPILVRAGRRFAAPPACSPGRSRPSPRTSSRVVIEIAPLASGCELTLTHAMQSKWADFAPRVEQGWTAMLGALGQALDEA